MFLSLIITYLLIYKYQHISSLTYSTIKSQIAATSAFSSQRLNDSSSIFFLLRYLLLCQICTIGKWKSLKFSGKNSTLSSVTAILFSLGLSRKAYLLHVFFCSFSSFLCSPEQYPLSHFSFFSRYLFKLLQHSSFF